VEWVTDWLTGLPPTTVYLLAGALLAAEVGVLAGVVVPAGSILLSLGVLASAGRIELPVAIAVAVAAALLGDSIAYWEGRYAGAKLRDSGLGRWIGGRRWRRAECAVRNGATAIVIGRWTGYVRTLVPRIAGASGMAYRRFLLLNATAVAVWMPGTILLGYLGANRLS
jgi:membrane-associated protein